MMVSRPPAKARLPKPIISSRVSRRPRKVAWRQRAEKILARIRSRAIELRVQVVFEHDAFLEFAARDLEDVNAPADPRVRL